MFAVKDFRTSGYGEVCVGFSDHFGRPADYLHETCEQSRYGWGSFFILSTIRAISSISRSVSLRKPPRVVQQVRSSPSFYPSIPASAVPRSITFGEKRHVVAAEQRLPLL